MSNGTINKFYLNLSGNFMEAEIITIGTELLLGEIVDTNTRTIARALRDIGLDLYRTTTVGDNVERIAQVVRESISRAQAVITTGGLGPTVDDPTREAIALAVGVPVEFQPQLWDEIHQRYKHFGREPSENSRRMAFTPQGAIPISNPVGTAPAFIVETENATIVSLPGVPAELSVLLETEVIPYLQKRLQLTEVIRARILRTVGIGESTLDEQIADLEYLSNPTVGLAAHPGRVDIRITAKGEDEVTVTKRIDEIEAIIRQRLGDVIFGTDEETLEGVTSNLLLESGHKMVTVESGTGGMLTNSLAGKCDPCVAGKVLEEIPNLEGLKEILRMTAQENDADVGVGIILRKAQDHTKIDLGILLNDQFSTQSKTYGGAPKNAPYWASSHALAYLRKLLISK
jgi:nicotinamide-nucleotide amidase